MKKLSLLVLFCASSLHAASFCGRQQQDIRILLAETPSRISFVNRGGLFNGGVCWWHSRLQRSSAYLAKFRPGQRKPTRPEVMNILAKLRQMSGIAMIPGYSDFHSFTRDHEKEVQAMLDSWQKVDGFFNFQWIRGISGRSQLDPGSMKEQMDLVYAYYKLTPAPLWVMAQIKGITSHALLVVKMFPTDNGYVLDVIDSNHPLETLTIDYFYGESNLKAPKDSYAFVPYVGFQKDFQSISATLRRACPQGMFSQKQDIRPGQIERLR